jgi:hypothetical protein
VSNETKIVSTRVDYEYQFGSSVINILIEQIFIFVNRIVKKQKLNILKPLNISNFLYSNWL